VHFKRKKSKKKPNILFCIADDAKWKHMSIYVTKWINTPALDRVAKQGLLFNNAYTSNAKY
jgi:arylsulfatase A-like enzyme